MLTLLVFLSMSFGFFGIVNSQHTNAYKSAYELWVTHKVFARKDHHIRDPKRCHKRSNSGNDVIKKPGVCNKEVCSKVESLARQICRINDIYFIILYTFYCISAITFIAVAYDAETVTRVYSFGNLTSTNLGSYQNLTENGVSLLLTIVLTASVFYLSKLNNFSKKSSSIDKKLFQVWWKHKCPRHKDEDLRINKEPKRLYEILAEEIGSENIKDAEEEEKNLIKNMKSKKTLDTQAKESMKDLNFFPRI